ncbi:RNA-dependent DNA polymerase [Patescibacteria group bacterium]|nr:RNA-dependent DNA polymerase [Patescibacteria group bacterium]
MFQCWNQYKRGKRKRQDIQLFERNLEDNIFALYDDLTTLKYQHGSYHHFYVTDPKQRHISKASVRDRLVHQVVYNAIFKIFDKKFIFHSLSSRPGKGTHLGVKQLSQMIGKISANGKLPCYALKMDIKRFFDSVNHQILKILIQKSIQEEKTLSIINSIIDSFKVSIGASGEVGIPLGNITSQLFANLYLHELDEFIKHKLREQYYLRYCDDFIILSRDRSHLTSLIALIQEFLKKNLQLELHPKKVVIRKLTQGIDFVGYVLFAKYILLRNKTKQRMKKRLKEAFEFFLIGKIDAKAMDQRLQSYLGILSHANQHTFTQVIKNAYWVRNDTVN